MKAGTCKHFNGIQNDTCDKGIAYEQFRQEGIAVFNTFPCFGKCGGCGSREYPSQDDIEAEEKDFEKFMVPVQLIDGAIGRGEKSGSFTHDDCGGTIRWEFRASLAASGKCDKCDWGMIS